jgi:hypothetical protein
MIRLYLMINFIEMKIKYHKMLIVLYYKVNKILHKKNKKK